MYTPETRGLWAFGLLVLVGCDPITSTPVNDAPVSGESTSGEMLGADTGNPGGASNGSALPSSGVDTSGTTGSASNTTGSATGGTSGGGSGGTTGGGTTGSTTASQIKGTAFSAKCSSYGLAANGKCAGYYCGVSAEQIGKELTGMGPCGALTADRICEGKISRTVTKCARDEKTAATLEIPGPSKEELRMRVQNCVYKDADLKANVVPQCLSCFLDAAQCASDNCVTQCLSGDSASCDKCRLDNNCNQPVPGCGGFPSPF